MLQISDEELLTDIEETKKEVRAYKLLYEGFSILASLLENTDSKFLYSMEANKYEELVRGCEDFFGELIDIKRVRNLQ